jgi:uncharacterized YigZ family protein
VEKRLKTIAEKAEGQYKEKGSRFLAFGFPVSDETEVKAVLASLRKEHHSARHHCYAYRIGPDPFRSRMNDDGEPSGTAGRPIFGQIVSHAMTNILVVVVRYFGGTLLGTSGLIVAYREAVNDMLSHASFVDMVFMTPCRLTFPFQALDRVMKIIKEETLSFTGPVYDNACSLTVMVPADILMLFKKEMIHIEGLTISELKETMTGKMNTDSKNNSTMN